MNVNVIVMMESLSLAWSEDLNSGDFKGRRLERMAGLVLVLLYLPRVYQAPRY